MPLISRERQCPTEDDGPRPRPIKHQLFNEDGSFSNSRASSDTLRDLKKFASHGGPNLGDLRGFSLDHQSGPARTSTVRSSTSEKSGYDGDSTPMALIDSHIYPNAYRLVNGEALPKPSNWSEIRSELQRQTDLKLKVGDFEYFQEVNSSAVNESDLFDILQSLQGRFSNHRCCASNVRFSNLEPIAKKSIKSCNPSRYYGARPETLHVEIRTTLVSKIQPAFEKDLPIVPNLFLALKGPDSTPYVASWQSVHEGAVGARAIHALREYAQNPKLYDNKAYSLAAIYHCGTLLIFTSHIHRPNPESSYWTVTTLVGGWCMISDPKQYRDGLFAFRKALELCERFRDEAIREANDFHRKSHIDQSALSKQKTVSGARMIVETRSPTPASSQ